jgi:Spy/CpxP family protein refolding chaperone
MKLSILKAVTLGIALTLIPSCFSADEAKPAQHKRGGDLQGLLEKLNLTDEQKAKVKPIMDKAAADAHEYMTAHADELKAARESNDPEKKKAAFGPMMEKRKATLEEIKPILTDEQKKKLEELQAAHGGHGPKGNK